jgi:hypothetical protein
MSNDHRVHVRVVVFPGTAEEREDLYSAVRHHCVCSEGAGVGTCPPHDLLLGEATLKRLVFYRRWRGSLRRGEWLEDPLWRAI